MADARQNDAQQNDARQNGGDGASDRPQAEPAASEPVLTPQQQQEAHRYGQLELRCELADKLLDVTYLAMMAFLAARPVDQWLEQFGLFEQYASLRLIGLYLITMFGHVVASFPLSYYSGYSLQRRFGLSRQTRRAWLARYAKRNGLAIAFGLVMFLGLFWVIWLCGQLWWLVAAGLFFLVSVLMGQLAPVLILPLFYKIEKLEHGELTERLDRLAEGTGLSIEGIYRMELSAETAKANAMLAGLGRTRRVILGDTLLEQFTPEEIEVIFAHEIGHHVHRHIRKMIVAGVGYSLIGFWLCDQILAWQAGPTARADLPVHTLPLLMFLLTAFSLLLEPLQNAISRHFERQSDRYALTRTGNAAAYVSAFRKLAKLNKEDPAPHPLEVLWLHSHPPIAQRLAMAESEAVAP